MRLSEMARVEEKWQRKRALKSAEESHVTPDFRLQQNLQRYWKRGKLE